MKKLLFILLSILMLGSCTKHYLTADRIVYQVWGNGNLLTIYSNTEHKTISINLDKDYTYTEMIKPGDSIDVFMLSSYMPPSGIKVLMGQSVLYEGTPDSTGFIHIQKKFHQEDFRLK